MLRQRELVVDLLIRLKKLSRCYQLATEEQRGRLLSASQGLFDKLVAQGFEREFVETLMISGKDFLESFYKDKDRLDEVWLNTKLIFS